MAYYVDEKRFTAFHPGVTLAEKLEEMKMSVKEFAVRSGKPEKTIIAIIGGNSSVTPDMAVAFENVTQIPAGFWLKKQGNYDEYVARKKQEELLCESIVWARNFPFAEMAKMGWLQLTNDPVARVGQLLAFFGVSSPKAWNDYYMNQKLKIAFSISLSEVTNPYVMSAWLRKGEIQFAEEQRVRCSYSEKAFKAALPLLQDILGDECEDPFERAWRFCSEYGVVLVKTQRLKGMNVQGAIRWIKGTPCIQLSDNMLDYQKFKPVFFHEIGHLILHGKKDVFIECPCDFYQKERKEKEAEADAFAQTLMH